jgi:hypothetical protein
MLQGWEKGNVVLYYISYNDCHTTTPLHHSYCSRYHLQLPLQFFILILYLAKQICVTITKHSICIVMHFLLLLKVAKQYIFWCFKKQHNGLTSKLYLSYKASKSEIPPSETTFKASTYASIYRNI